jgi:hypothetical protein
MRDGWRRWKKGTKRLSSKHSTHCSTNGIMRRPPNLYQPQACRLLALNGPIDPAYDVRCSGQTGSHRRTVKPTRLTQLRHWREASVPRFAFRTTAALRSPRPPRGRLVSRKKSNDDRNIGLGPNHDWSSHAADGFGLMCIHYDQPEGASQPRERYRSRKSASSGGSWQSA